MRASVLWLKELTTGLEGVSAQELAERLTLAGLELESITEHGRGLDAVEVVEVERVEAHPARDRLRLVTVSRGADRSLRVVCGAPNVPAPGGLVVLAPVGTTLPGGLTLEPRSIGGVPSEGMLCSEAELGLAESSDGILTLPPGSAAPGTRFLDAFPQAGDTVLELGVTPNRPDALGHLGLARELAALFGLPFAPLATPTENPALDASETSLASLIRLDNTDPERCPDYAAAAVVGLTVGPSPLPMQWRLRMLGVRPVSNVVDVTNWMLLEFGHPMHAFDLERLRGGRVVVRRAREAEPFRTLDGVDRALVEDDLVICDGEGPIALAGVMGGQDTEIRETTRSVLLECAYFTPRGVRRTGRRHGLHTESSFRFERGVDWADLDAVLARAKSLVAKLGGGQVVQGVSHAGGGAPTLPEIRLRSARLDALLGVAVPFEEALGILERLGLEVIERGPDAALVRGASFRPDLTLEADLIEEVARVRGFERIPSVLPRVRPNEPATAGALERCAAESAVALGLSEAVTLAFVSPESLAAVAAPPPVVRLQRPLGAERSVMRTSLLPGLLETVRRARHRGEHSLRLFSVGSVFLAPSAAERSAAAERARPRTREERPVLPREEPWFACVLAGERSAYLSKPETVDVFDAKGLAEELVWRLIGRRAEVAAAPDASEHPALHPRGAGLVLVDGERVGRLGPLHPSVVEALDLGGAVQVVELELALLEALGRRAPRYRPIARLPAVTRDLALVVSDDVPSADVATLVRQTAGELCESVELFDLFRGASIPADFRSLAFHVTYRHPLAASAPDSARTLTDAEVDVLHAEVVRSAEARYGATLRR